MANILAIETSGSNCGVGIWKDENDPIIFEQQGSKIHSEKLPEFVQAVLKKSKITLHELDAIAISSGPGSYTGLRIGMSFAKGLAFGANIQLLPINTIDCIAKGINNNNDFTILVYSHAEFVYEKNEADSANNKITQTEIKDNYPNSVVCVNFPENKRKFEHADYILPSVKYVGEYAMKNFDYLNKPNIIDVSPGYYSEFKIRN